MAGRPAIYDSGDFPASLRLIKQLIGWEEFPAMKEQAAKEGRKLGIGIGCYVDGTGLGPYEGGYVQVEPSGRVLVATALSTQGQSHETILAQIAADELGVPIDRVQVTTGGSRSHARPSRPTTYSAHARKLTDESLSVMSSCRRGLLPARRAAAARPIWRQAN